MDKIRKTLADVIWNGGAIATDRAEELVNLLLKDRLNKINDKNCVYFNGLEYHLTDKQIIEVRILLRAYFK